MAALGLPESPFEYVGTHIRVGPGIRAGTADFWMEAE